MVRNLPMKKGFPVLWVFVGGASGAPTGGPAIDPLLVPARPTTQQFYIAEISTALTIGPFFRFDVYLTVQYGSKSVSWITAIFEIRYTTIISPIDSETLT